MNTHAPCGACRALVSIESGCAHWQPRGKVRAPSARATAERDAATQAAEMLREVTEGRNPTSRLAALRRAPLQRELLQQCINSGDAGVSPGGDTGIYKNFRKMEQQGYVEKIGQRTGRTSTIRYHITPLGRAVMGEYLRAYPHGQMLPLPLPPRP